MTMLIAIAAIAVVVVAVAAACRVLLEPRIERGRLSYGRAAVTTLVALLVAPTIGAAFAAAATTGERAAAVGPVYFYAGYAIGLVCFIVQNRRYRRIAGDA